MANQHLNRAKKIVNDEFYTFEKDIEKELTNYKDFFNNKKIVCPCDDENSNFVTFLKNKKNDWKIKKISYVKNYQNCDYSEYDIIVTNPPFSKFRDFFNLIISKKINFIIVSPLTILSNKLIIELFINNKLDSGFNSIVKFFDYKNNIQNAPAIWLTNLIIGQKKLKLKNL